MRFIICKLTLYVYSIKSVTHTALFNAMLVSVHYSNCVLLLINKVYTDPLECHCILCCINITLFFCATRVYLQSDVIWFAELCVYLSPGIHQCHTFNSKAFVLAPSSWSLWNPNSVLQIEDNTGGSVLLYLHRIHLHRFNMRGRLVKCTEGHRYK